MSEQNIPGIENLNHDLEDLSARLDQLPLVDHAAEYERIITELSEQLRQEN